MYKCCLSICRTLQSVLPTAVVAYLIVLLFWTYGKFEPEKYEEQNLLDVEKYLIEDSIHCEDVALGCFQLYPAIIKVKKQSFDWLITFNYMTTQWCVTYCSSQKMKYAGVFDGNMCACANDPLKLTNLEYGKCDVTCAGDKTKFCGGLNTIYLSRITTPCFRNISFGLDKRLVGYFKESSVAKQSYKSGLTPFKCMLYCGKVVKHPLAMFKHDQRKCYCEMMTDSFNLSHRVNKKIASADDVAVYRTLTSDTRCDVIRFLPPKNYNRTVMTSFPGSGNTWVRYLLERASGYYTGSVYNDKSLFKAGFLGEVPHISSTRTIVFKNHYLNQYPKDVFESVILLIRNPFDAVLADYNRVKSNGNHIGSAKNDDYYSKDFQRYFNASIKQWTNVVDLVIQTNRLYIVIYYEDILNNPIKETKKMINFVKFDQFFNMESQRLLCLSENINGVLKRPKKLLKTSPFTADMIKNTNLEIKKVESMLKVNLNKYKKS